MSEQETPESAPVGARNDEGLLSAEERAACEAVAKGEAPHSQRARTLLALDDGAGQAEAAELSGLTEGQVRYWLGRFRPRRLSIFPEETLRLAQAELAAPAAPPAFEPATEVVAEPEAKPVAEPAPEPAASVEEASKALEMESKPMKKKKKTKKDKKAAKKGKKEKAGKKAKNKKARKSKKEKKGTDKSPKKAKKKDKKAKKTKSNKKV